MSHTYVQFKLRLPAELIASLVAEATENRRSTSAELIHRLKSTFRSQSAVTLDNATAERLIEALQNHITK